MSRVKIMSIIAQFLAHFGTPEADGFEVNCENANLTNHCAFPITTFALMFVY